MNPYTVNNMVSPISPGWSSWKQTEPGTLESLAANGLWPDDERCTVKRMFVPAEVGQGSALMIVRSSRIHRVSRSQPRATLHRQDRRLTASRRSMLHQTSVFNAESWSLSYHHHIPTTMYQNSDDGAGACGQEDRYHDVEGCI